MTDLSLQDRLARLKQKLKADDEAAKQRGTDGMSRASTRSDLSSIAVGTSPSAEVRWHHHGEGPLVTRLDNPLQRGGSDPAEADALRQQAESFRALASEAQAQVAHAKQARSEAELEMKSLRGKLHATQQRMGVLKEQLMSGQAAAEESEQQVVQDAVHRAEAAFGEKLKALQKEDDAHQRRIRLLETQLERHQTVESVSRAANEDVLKAQHQIDSLQGQCKAADARVAVAEAEALRLQRLLDSKAGELQNLELAMGDLTYEAESARGSELQSKQLQEELAQQQTETKKAEAGLLAAEQESRRERARAAELQVRCFSAEARCSALFEEDMQLKGLLAQKKAQLQALEDQGVATADRSRILTALLELLRGKTELQVPLASIAQALRLDNEQRQSLLEQAAAFQGQQGGLLRRILQPVRLLRPHVAPSSQATCTRLGPSVVTQTQDKVSLAKDWVHFLMDEEEGGPAQGENGAAGTSGAVPDVPTSADVLASTTPASSPLAHATADL